jgi:hypothetical protein
LIARRVLGSQLLPCHRRIMGPGPVPLFRGPPSQDGGGALFQPGAAPLAFSWLLITPLQKRGRWPSIVADTQGWDNSILQLLQRAPARLCQNKSTSHDLARSIGATRGVGSFAPRPWAPRPVCPIYAGPPASGIFCALCSPRLLEGGRGGS